MLLFEWMGLVGVVRAEFLRARNFDYVRAARALGVSNPRIMYRHMLPNAMVATLTFLPFITSGAVVTLTALDFLGFGMPPGSRRSVSCCNRVRTTSRRHGWGSLASSSSRSCSVCWCSSAKACATPSIRGVGRDQGIERSRDRSRDCDGGRREAEGEPGTRDQGPGAETRFCASRISACASVSGRRRRRCGARDLVRDRTRRRRWRWSARAARASR